MNTFLFRFESWLKKKRTRVLQAVLLLALLVGLTGLEIFLLKEVGNVATAIVTLPCITAAWLYGRNAGLLLTLILSILNLFLIYWVNADLISVRSIISTATGTVVALLLVTMTSWAHQTRQRMQHELIERQQIEKQLRASEERYRMLFHMASDAVFVFDLEGNLLETNQVLAGWLGYPPEKLQGMNLVEIETFENANRMPKRIDELLECEQVMYESALTRKDGSILPIEINVRLIDYQGQKAAFSIARDISQRKAIEMAEREQRLMADAMQDIAADLASTLHLEEVLERILKNIQRVIRHDAASIMLLNGSQVTVAKHRGYTERGQAERLNDSAISIEGIHTLHQMIHSRLPLVLPDVRSSPYWQDFRAARWVRSYAGAPVIYKGDIIGFINLDGALAGLFKEEHTWRLQAFANYAALAIQNARLYTSVQQLAQVDELTGLYNRRGMTNVAQREVHRARRYQRCLAVLLVDVDSFKTFNDLYSYSVGDEVLSSMADRLRSNVRSEDLVSRWGGDEFVVMLMECCMADALTIAENLRRVITERPFETTRGPLPVTVSIGVTGLTPAHMDLNAMVDAAGEGLHQAKYAGRNQIAGQS